MNRKPPRKPLTDERLDQIERDLEALAAEARRLYPKRRNETRAKYAHRIDGVIGRWLSEGHVETLFRLQGRI